MCNAGRKTQYAYLAMFDDKNDANAAGGIAKIDLLAGSPAAAVAAQIRFGRGRSGGEAVFIPRSMDVSKMEGAVRFSSIHRGLSPWSAI